MTREDILRELTRPFPAKYIHENPSGGGSYIKHHVIEQRLIQVFGLPPSFQVVEVLRGNVAALEPNPNAKSKRGREGAPELHNVAVGVIGEMQVNFPLDDQLNKVVVIREVGDCEEPHNWKSDGARLKDAASDAYKRCAMRLGCGLHLWSQDEYFLYDELERSQADNVAGSGQSEPQTAGGPSSPPASPPDSGGGGDQESRSGVVRSSPSGSASPSFSRSWADDMLKSFTEDEILSCSASLKGRSFDSLDALVESKPSPTTLREIAEKLNAGVPA